MAEASRTKSAWAAGTIALSLQAEDLKRTICTFDEGGSGDQRPDGPNRLDTPSSRFRASWNTLSRMQS